MKPQDKISKSSWILVESVKDALTNNFTKAVSDGQIKIASDQLEKVLSLVAASVDEGYSRGHKSFLKTVTMAVDEAVASAPTAKKK